MSPAAPPVSWVMPVFNGGRYLREAVESVLCQTFGDFEFIVINDGSTDGSAAVLEEYASRDRRLRVFSQENRGLVDALNRGCALARGELIARMDADDVSLPDRLRLQVAFLSEHPEVALLGGQLIIIDEENRIVRTSGGSAESAVLKERLFAGKPVFAHPAVVMRAQAFREAGGYRKPFLHAEDYDLWLRIAEHHEVANLPVPLLRHRVHPGQVTHQHVRQQIVSTLAARAAARVRRQTGEDPSAGWTVATEATLAGLGIDALALRDVLIREYLGRAKTMLNAGGVDGALACIDEALALARQAPVHRRGIAKAHKAFARIYFRQRRLAAGIAAAARAGLAYLACAAHAVLRGRP